MKQVKCRTVENFEGIRNLTTKISFDSLELYIGGFNIAVHQIFFSIINLTDIQLSVEDDK